MPTAWTFMPLSTGGFTLIDAADHERVSAFTWSQGTHGYPVRQKKEGGRGRCFLLHRELLGLQRGDKRQADHINRDRLDNRRCNLRVVTHAQNSQNEPAHGGSSKYRGVSWNKEKGKWQAYAMLAGRQKNLGYFDSETAAASVASHYRSVHMPFSED